MAIEFIVSTYVNMVDYLYVQVMRCLYGAATITDQVQEMGTRLSQLLRLQKVVISPKLLTDNALEDVFGTLDWYGQGININDDTSPL